MAYQNEPLADDEYRAWNGEIRKKPGTISFNGDADWEDVGFMTRGVRSKTTYGDGSVKKKPSKPVKVRHELTGELIDINPDDYSIYGRPKGDTVPTPEVKRARPKRR